MKEELPYGAIDLGIAHVRMPIPDPVRADLPDLVAHLARHRHPL